MVLRTEDFPQADVLDSVFLTVRAVAAGHTDDVGIETAIGLDSGARQGRYYRKAGVALGLLESAANSAHLTTEGLKLAAATSPSERLDLLRIAILSNEPLGMLVSEISPSGTSRQALLKFFESIYPGAVATAYRRLSTALSYISAVGLAEVGSDGLWRSIPVGAQPASPVPAGLLASLSPNSLESGEDQLGTLPQIPTVMQVDVDLQKHERANKIHEWLVQTVATRLHGRGIDSATTLHIDLMAAFEGSYVIYEMKSVNEDHSNLLSQIRKAVSQLHEYRYLYNLDASLCIVTNAPIPSDMKWLEEYLALDRGIAYAWIDESELSQVALHSDGLLADWM